MSKYCKPMGLYVTYLDCMECEDKECIQSQRKENKNNMRKWVAFFLLEPEQKVFFVFGDKRYKIVVQGVVKECTMGYGKQAKYCISGERVVHNKGRLTNEEAKGITFCCKNCNIDTGDTIGSLAVFTTKEKCIEWLRK